MTDATTKFVLIVRKTRLEELIERFNTWPQAKFYLEHSQADTKDYLREHDHYMAQRIEAEVILKRIGPVHVLERGYLPNYRFGSADIVIVLGQDGLVANTLKYLDGQPVIAINPDPRRFDGKVLPFELKDLPTIIRDTMLGKTPTREIALAQAQTNTGQSMLAVNDLFIGPKSHISAQYLLHWADRTERQSSSGIIVSTGFGSTGWFQSILAGAIGVTGQQRHKLQDGFDWSAKQLQFAVREPFPSQTTGTELVFGGITKKKTFTVESLMPEHGIIFSDGVESDWISFNAGTIATIGIAKRTGRMVWS